MKILAAALLMAFPIATCAQASFQDEQSGISFRYPASYRLTEGELGKDDEGLGYLGEIPMEFTQLGGARVATVEAPENAYPGTNFVNSFVTVSVNRFETREECTHFSDDEEGEKRSEERIGGTMFHGIEVSDAAMNHQFAGDYYHAFISGECVEVGEGVATAGLGVVDGIVAFPAGRVYATLDGIERSIAIEVPARDVSVGSPSIDSFEVTQTGPFDRYRISWSVRGANENSIWLTVDGVTEVLLHSPGEVAPEAKLATDKPNPLPLTAGSMELELRNLAGQNTQTHIRLFAAGQDSVSKTITVAPPELPDIVVVKSDSQRWLKSDTGSLQVEPGVTLEIDGLGFENQEKAQLDAMPLDVTTIDGRAVSVTLPASTPNGEYLLVLSDERGASNAVPVRIGNHFPRIEVIDGRPKISCNGGGAIVPGQTVRIEGAGFQQTNMIRIGRMSFQLQSSGKDDSNSFTFIAPRFLEPGFYEMYFTNQLGKSNTVEVAVVSGR
jgi:hypothetical protein